jgi:ABC-2 type transport system ATP-binding protein
MERVIMLELKNVSKAYGSKKALRDVSLSLPGGEIVGLFGENGAGKTTLMKCILGFLRCEGSITLDGEPITRKNIERISFATSEHSFFPGLTAQGHREFYAEHFPRFSDRRFAALMEFFDLPLHKALRSFSTGQKNQFEVILALSQGADYILMDEPFAGNDVFNREDFYKVLLGILEPGETVLLSTHLIEEVSGFVGRAILLRQGEIVGDRSTLALEEEGLDLMGFLKATYHYRADRVSKALGDLTGEQEDGA